jgi:ArsR family transcriptional regulator, arsenate/arsenite/antimonite-responsive transcriptional repressor
MASKKKPTLQDVLRSFRNCGPLFMALGDPARQDIIMLLAEYERLNVNAIAERMTLSRPAVSHHLKVLLQAGVVRQERESRENFYQLELDDVLSRLRTLIEQAEVSCG